jgi:hypothetical protein
VSGGVRRQFETVARRYLPPLPEEREKREGQEEETEEQQGGEKKHPSASVGVSLLAPSAA